MRLRDGLGQLGRPARYVLAALAVVAASGVIAMLGPVQLAVGSLVYLGAVIAVAVVAGRGPALLSAVAAFVALNFLFTEPRYTLAVSDPAALATLVSFLLVAAITSQLAAGLRERAEEAHARERESSILHAIAARLASQPVGTALPEIAERIRADLDVAATSIDLSTGVRRAVAGNVESLRAATTGGGSSSVFGPGEQASRWMRVASPLRGGTTGRDVHRVPVEGTGGLLGTLIVLTHPGHRLDDRAGRLLATIGGLIALAAEQDAYRRDALEAEVLRRTDDVRARLLDAVSHDLRTPLASILAAAGSLGQTDVAWTDADRVEFATTIEHEAARLDRIVSNLLDASRIQSGTLVPALAWHEPATLLSDILERLRQAWPHRDIRLRAADDLRPVLMDAVEIDQVVANLVENAIHHAPAGPPIVVRAEIVDDELHVAVEDDGPGIPPEIAERAFEPFVRSSARDRDRTGLGLTVARGLVSAHGGRIWAENRREGGTRISFVLPAHPAPLGP
jgi:two-component system, OmpR family, sensor histidine kinase KdpD